MAEIDVKTSDNEYEVTVKERGSQTKHKVTLSEGLYEDLTGGKVSKDECIRTAFQFLLEREPKEAILGSFDLSVISRYFPEFEERFSDYLR